MRLAILILLAIITNLSCKKATYMDSGTLTGIDARLCVCCGGTWIKINSNQKTYLMGDFPAFNINSSSTFPISVQLDWEVDSLHCYGNYIKVLSGVRLP